MKSVNLITAIFCTAILLHGCSNAPLLAVSESKRDTSGTFDGRWQGVVTNTPPTQQSSGNVSYMRCGDRTGERIGPITVKDGKATVRYRGESGETYVSKKGGFKFQIPIAGGGFSGGDASFVAKKDTAVIAASLETGKGTIKLATADLGGAGCQSDISIKKI